MSIPNSQTLKRIPIITISDYQRTYVKKIYGYSGTGGFVGIVEVTGRDHVTEIFNIFVRPGFDSNAGWQDTRDGKIHF